MRAGPIDHGRLLDRREQLFTPDPRLGWVFRDRWWFLKPFTEPAPERRHMPDYLERRVQETEQLVRHRMGRTLPLSIAASVILLLFSGCSESDYALSRTPLPVGSLLLAVVAALPGGLLTLLARQQHRAARDAYDLAHRQTVGGYEAAMAQWQERKRHHDASEHARLNSLPEWGPVARPASLRRLDIFGGNLWSWEALLTTYGSSTLAGQPLLVLDLSRELVCGELIELAGPQWISVDTWRLPSQLAASPLLSGLSATELVDAIVESMHADTSDTTRAERSMDDRILGRVCDALGDQVTLARIGAALRALMGEPDNGQALTREERRRITNELFTVEYRRQVHANLARIESYLHPLETLGTSPAPESGRGHLTCIALDSHARNVRSELLTDLIVQWITARVTASSEPRPAVVIVGADELARRHLERLSDACERRGVPLTLLFRQLRDTSQEMIGGGNVAFMRLGNHEDAAAAADFIGRDYRFVLSQVTKNVGGNESHTTTDTTGEGTSDTTSTSHTTGTSTSWSTSRSSGTTYAGGPFFPDRATNRQRGNSRGGGTNQSDTTGFARSTSRNWSAAYAYAEGTNWSDADTSQRVYEYVVEPVTLQHLPDHALLLVESTPGGGRTIAPVECDPAIITLDRASTTALPEPPADAPAITSSQVSTGFDHPAPAQPHWAAAIWPPTTPPPRAPLSQEPGPPPGYRTGPRPDQIDTPQPPPASPRPQARQRTTGDSGNPHRPGPPPLFGGRE